MNEFANGDTPTRIVVHVELLAAPEGHNTSGIVHNKVEIPVIMQISKSWTFCVSVTIPQRISTQDLTGLRIDLDKGDNKIFTFEVKLETPHGVDVKEFQHISPVGYIKGFATYTFSGEETRELCIEPKGLDESEMFSIIEVRQLWDILNQALGI